RAQSSMAYSTNGLAAVMARVGWGCLVAATVPSGGGGQAQSAAHGSTRVLHTAGYSMPANWCPSAPSMSVDAENRPNRVGAPLGGVGTRTRGSAVVLVGVSGAVTGAPFHCGVGN